MKKVIWMFLLGSLALAMSSCEMETTDNGDLDGFWHLCQYSLRVDVAELLCEQRERSKQHQHHNNLFHVFLLFCYLILFLNFGGMPLVG